MSTFNYIPLRQQPIYTVIYSLICGVHKKDDNPIKLLTDKYSFDDLINSGFDSDTNCILIFNGEYYDLNSYTSNLYSRRILFFESSSDFGVNFDIYFDKFIYVEALDNFMLYMFENSDNSCKEELIRNYNFLLKDSRYMITLVEKGENVSDNLKIYNNEESLEFQYDNSIAYRS